MVAAEKQSKFPDMMLQRKREKLMARLEEKKWLGLYQKSWHQRISCVKTK
jgi:hypothetical protein